MIGDRGGNAGLPGRSKTFAKTNPSREGSPAGQGGAIRRVGCPKFCSRLLFPEIGDRRRENGNGRADPTTASVRQIARLSVQVWAMPTLNVAYKPREKDKSTKEGK